MIALYIVGALVALILLIIFSDIRIKIVYDGDIIVKLKFWFVSYTLIPSKDKKQKPDKKPKTDKKSPEKKKSKPLTQTVPMVIDVVKLVLEKLKPVLKSVRMRPLRLTAYVGGGDAAVTAITTGAVNAIVWPFAGWLSRTVKVKGTDISVEPDYEGKTRLYFKTCIRIRLNRILSAGTGVLVGIYKLNSDKDGAEK